MNLSSLQDFLSVGASLPAATNCWKIRRPCEREGQRNTFFIFWALLSANAIIAIIAWVRAENRFVLRIYCYLFRSYIARLWTPLHPFG